VTASISIFEVAALRAEVERLTEQLQAATAENRLLTEERDQGLYRIDALTESLERYKDRARMAVEDRQ
jgi:hypothetical protein